jgi:hypothetical protein
VPDSRGRCTRTRSTLVCLSACLFVSLFLRGSLGGLDCERRFSADGRRARTRASAAAVAAVACGNRLRRVRNVDHARSSQCGAWSTGAHGHRSACVRAEPGRDGLLRHLVNSAHGRRRGARGHCALVGGRGRCPRALDAEPTCARGSAQVSSGRKRRSRRRGPLNVEGQSVGPRPGGRSPEHAKACCRADWFRRRLAVWQLRCWATQAMRGRCCPGAQQRAERVP